MNAGDLLQHFRYEVDDLEDPYLWSDDEVFEYMTDAERMFCRLTEGIEEARLPQICQLSVVPGTDWYAVSPLILKLRWATRGDNGRTITVSNPEKLALDGIAFDSGTGGPVRALVAGMSKGVLRAWPMPNETVTINLGVFRLPLTPLTSEVSAFEIDEQHHIHLLSWMKHRAYNKHDADTYDPKQAEKYETVFRNYCFKALAEQERARRQVGTVIYGGI